MSEEDRKWLEQLIRENKKSDSELTYTYCPFSVLYALQQENKELKLDRKHLLVLQKSMDKQYEELEQENKQLKFQLEYEKENLMFSKDYAKYLEEKRNKYKSVLDEIKEYIEKDYGFAKRHDIPLLTKDEQLAGKLFEILDKVKQ